ncbi:hypothetical protein NX059_007470 [Plenodomus lindquistii]|nr:hypothetical protein NX059_007470 [Plenodomus lindquistii]
MRYIRFLKTPRVVCDKSPSRPHVQCLVTVTSDLGDSFLPYNVQLTAELLACDSHHHETVLAWGFVQWTAGMRSLPIKLPLPKSSGASTPLRFKVGTTPKSTADEFQGLATEYCSSIVSAWSAPFTGSSEAPRLVERRFQMATGTLNIWEETGNSIARHLWDAGLMLSCRLEQLLSPGSELAHVLLPDRHQSSFRILELGTGCGIVGIALAQHLENTAIIVTDLAEASEIVQHNLRYVTTAAGSSVYFQELAWDGELPRTLDSTDFASDLILAADCTYNADSRYASMTACAASTLGRLISVSPALVDTICRLVRKSPCTMVAVAMKIRHASEVVFFELMAAAAFIKVSAITFPLPGDTTNSEETVDLHVFRYGNST